MSTFETEAAVAQGFDLMLEDHGCLVLSGHFDYTGPEGSGCSQGLGYQVDAAFLKRFLQAFGVERLQQVNGKPCWVTHDSSRISRIAPFTERGGVSFDIEVWRAEKQAEAETP